MRRKRFEELLSLIHLHYDWLLAKRAANMFEHDGRPAPDPLPKAIAISALYFPRFIDALQELDIRSKEFIGWTLEAARRRVDGHSDGEAKDFRPAYASYYQQYLSVEQLITDHAISTRGEV
jgi:hypothetical protein